MKLFTALFLTLGLSFAATASEDGSNGSNDGQIRNVAQYNLNEGLALQGYDPVSYFNGTALMGSEDISLDYKGVIYNFASEDNLREFMTDTAKYEPTYGGWCAFAMASGDKVRIEPEIFVVDGRRLHLFVSEEARGLWNARAARLERRADSQWRRISREEPRL